MHGYKWPINCTRTRTGGVGDGYQTASLLPLLGSTIINSVSFGTESAAEALQGIDGETRALEIVNLLLHWFKVAADDTPLCLVLDDAQFIDKTSWMLLQKVAQIPSLVVVIGFRTGDGLTVKDDEIRPLLDDTAR